MTNTFYHGDCLFVMNHDIEPNSIDLIYLDPPFFTGKVQKGTAKWQPGAMEVSYEDSKRFWGDTEKVNAMRTKSPEWLKHIAGGKHPRPDFASYLFYMMERLEACHKVLNDKGSIYLHCDWRASHYLKMIMDGIFEDANFQNEVVWEYFQGGKSHNRFGRKHDIVFYYTKSDRWHFNANEVRQPYAPSTIERYKTPLQDGKIHTLNPNGKVISDVWTDVHSISRSARERVGYPTQKPLALLERIIKASSNKGDTILDPFCGCGTAIIAAQIHGRQWIGIDISKQAYEVSKDRYHQLSFESQFGQPEPQYIERTLDDIKKLKATKPKTIKPTEGEITFEEWVNEYFKATKPHPDKGVDGIMQDGTPIQTKTNKIKEPVLHQFLSQITTHPKVPQPVKRAIAVSKIGFDDNARQLQFTIQTRDGIKVEILTPAKMLEGDGIR